MHNFIQNFVREPDGLWRCTSSAEVWHIHGRIQVAEGTRFVPGTIFMAVDIVQLLEQEREHQDRH